MDHFFNGNIFFLKSQKEENNISKGIIDQFWEKWIYYIDFNSVCTIKIEVNTDIEKETNNKNNLQIWLKFLNWAKTRL